MTAILAERFADPRRTEDPWRALWAMMVGFFMILLDATIVAVANPEILEHLDTDYDGVLWVTSAYLLAYAVPLLLAGRLGDRYGPKNLYLYGLGVFTAASLWCGLSGSIGWLITARVVQGIGAALMTPQTLSTITRIFPADRRGVALSVWGATAGVATLVGPLAGGFLVDGLGWQWIFIVNVPIGIAGLALAFWFVPTLPTARQGIDFLGVASSGIGLFLVVFGLQEGESHGWAWWIWAMVAAGVGCMAGFVYWQSINRETPLIPLNIFRDNDFSMSNVGITVIGFAVTAQVVPMMFYAQAVCGLSPTRSALLMAPTAIASGVLAPFVGRIVDRAHPRPIVGFGFSAVAISLTWLSFELTPTTPIWRLVLPLTLLGIGMAFIWAPLAATATRNLPPHLAGAGSGVYNTTRQVGGVLGSAGIAAFMTSRLGAELPGMTLGGNTTEGTVPELPEFLKAPFSAALSQSLLLPAFVALFGVVAAIYLRGFGDDVLVRPAQRVTDQGPDELETFTAALRMRDYDPADDHYFRDDDEYAEYTIDWPDEPEPAPVSAPVQVDIPADESVTEPLFVHVEHPLHAPAETWHSGPVESWHSLLEDELDDELQDEPAGQPEVWTESVPEPVAEVSAPVYDAPEPTVADEHDSWFGSFDDLMSDRQPVPSAEPIGFAHNGFHVDSNNGFGGHQLEVPPSPRPSGGRHSRGDDDSGTYGKHSMPFRE